jgi:hypothetical protein
MKGRPRTHDKREGDHNITLASEKAKAALALLK